ncbi:hypothetical protein GTR04_4888 [Trichophyton interdigitale]|uniref:Uncharacterized protein n=1 Tax=Trichophyton equinum (strain ATCC MYA-4606 / CBS 127.97) TaxID=559882 RepID=F2PYI3_TRIEC|nr:hypothetical protein TEQG_06004 [Trichophyton equinum CBS 127.97]KAF3891698.1 hypothetical protein GY631_4721 [Trichophyton interdigitale]KAG5219022.1 hypothetical protein GY632_4961 [Trichophyton interdigitale]KAG8207748.1 hypothetical protein GTR04_4888 [Trichophyton interdigitale]
MKTSLILAMTFVSVTIALPKGQTPSTVVSQQAVCANGTPCTHQEQCTRFGRECFCQNGGAEGAAGLCANWVELAHGATGGH